MLSVKQALSHHESLDFIFEDDAIDTINDIKLLESHIVYFSAGQSKIKEILVKRDPSFSV